jgi:hypothetical protein
MKFEELKAKINDGTLDIENDIKFETPSILAQRQIIQNILNVSIVDFENGLKKIDFAIYEMFRIAGIIEGFTDIEVDLTQPSEQNPEEVEINIDCVIDLYDNVAKNCKLMVALEINANDFTELLELSRDQELKLINSVEYILAVGLNKIVEKFPDNKELGKLMGKVPGLINKINADKLEYLTSALKFNNGIKEK